MSSVFGSSGSQFRRELSVKPHSDFLVAESLCGLNLSYSFVDLSDEPWIEVDQSLDRLDRLDQQLVDISHLFGGKLGELMFKPVWEGSGIGRGEGEERPMSNDVFVSECYSATSYPGAGSRRSR